MLKNIDKRALLEGLGLWGRWILVGFPAGILTIGWLAIGLSLQAIIAGVGGEAALIVFLMYLVGGLLFAPLAAFFQWLVTRRVLTRARGWIWSTAGAWMCLFVVLPFAPALLRNAASAQLMGILGAATAVIVSCLQWLQLRRHVDGAHYWIVGAVVSSGIAACAFVTLARDSDLSGIAVLGIALLLAAMLSGVAVVFLLASAGHPIAATLGPAGASLVLVLAGWLMLAASYRQQISTLWAHETPAKSVAFSADGKFVASASSGLLSTPHDSAATAQLWAVSAGNQLRPADAQVIRLPAPASYPNDFNSMVFTQRDSILVADVESGALNIWDLGTSEKILHLHVTTANRSVRALGFAREDGMLAVPGSNSSLKLYDVASGAGLAVLTPERQRTQIEAIAFSPAGDLVAAAYNAGTATAIFVWDVSTGRQVLALTGPRGPVRLVFSPDGGLLACGTPYPSYSGSTRRISAVVWDVKTAQVRHSIEGPAVTGLAFSPDGALLALARSYSNGILIWDVAAGRELAVLHGGKDVESIAYSPDGRLLVTGSADGALRLWAAPKSPSRD